MSTPNFDSRYATVPKTGVNNLTGRFHAAGYGVKADGATDDTTALQACITAAQTAGEGNTVILPPGNIMVTGITIAMNRLVRIQGAGIGYVGGSAGTRIKRIDTGTGVLVQGAGYVGTLANVGDTTKRCRLELYDLELNGNNTAGEILNVYRGQQIRIERVRVRSSTATGAHFTQLFNSAFSQFFVSYCGGGTASPALVLDSTTGEGTAAGCNTVHFSDCEWETNAGTDIYVDGSSADISPSAGILFNGTKIERNSGEFPEIYFGYCHTVQFTNLYAYVQSSATPMIQQAGTTGPNKINSAMIANGGSAAYWIDHTAGTLHLTDIRCAGTPGSNYIHIGSSVAVSSNAHMAKNIQGDAPTKIYSDARTSYGQIGVRYYSLPITFATNASVMVNNGAPGWSFAHGSSTPIVSGIITIPNDCVIGAIGGVTIRWATSSTGTGNVIWRYALRDITPGNTIALGTTTGTATSAATGTANLMIDIAAGGITLNPGHMFQYVLYRDGANASDVYADPAYLMTAHLVYQYVI